MRKFRYVEPGDDGVTPVFVDVSEREIMEKYYPYWLRQMEIAGKHGLISPENCVQDWIVVHWAKEIPSK